MTDAFDDPIRAAVARRRERTDDEHRISAKPEHVDTRRDRILHGLVLTDIPILVVSHTQQRFAARNLRSIEAITVRPISDVVAVLLEPVGERKLEAQPLTGT